MNKFTKFIIIFPILLFGCRIKPQANNDNSLIIDNFSMNIFSQNGNKVYSVHSPLSSYNRDTQVFNLDKTKIQLYKDNKIEYIINSENSKLYNNNKTVELNGNIAIKTLTGENNNLIANKFIWNINNSECVLTGNVKYENDKIILVSSKALFNKGTNIIEFFNPVKYIIKGDKKYNNYEVNSENAYYNIYTESVIFKSKKDKVRSKIYF